MKIAVIGTGYWGPNLVRNLVALRQNVLVFDRIAERAAATAARFARCTQAPSLEYILNDASIEAVAIAVPVCNHCDLILQSLEAGKHIFVEKPLCQTLEETDRIARSMNGMVLMTGHITAFSPGIRAFKQCIGEGLIGELQSLSLVRKHCGPVYRATDVLTEVASHDIAVLLMTPATMPRSVIARGYSRLGGKDPDAVYCLLEWYNGVNAYVEAQWASALRKRTIIAEGTSGTLHFDVIDGVERLAVYEQTTIFDALRKGVTQREMSGVMPEKKEIALPGGEPLYEELKEFIACITESRQPATGFDFGKKVVTVLTAARSSMEKSGEKVAVL